MDPEIRILQWNACGFNSPKRGEFTKFLSKSKKLPDIICVQETFWKEGIHNIRIKGYQIVRQDRPGTKSRGGIATLIKDNLSYKVVKGPPDIESLTVSVPIKTGGTLEISNVYLPPKMNECVIEGALSNLMLHPSKIILGDLNAYGATFGAVKPNNRGKMIETVMEKSKYVALNTGQGTHQKQRNDTSPIDLTIASPSLARKCTWSVLKEDFGSDHYPILTILNEPPLIEKSNDCRLAYKYAKWNEFRRNCQENVTSNNIPNDVELGNIFLINKIINNAKNNIPIKKTKTTKPQVPWWNTECAQAVRARKKAKYRYRSHPTLENRQEYFSKRAQAQRTIRNAKQVSWQNYCETLDGSTSLSKVWGTVRKMSGINNTRTVPTIKLGNDEYGTNKGKAEIFAKTFSRVSSNENLSPEFLAKRASFEKNHHDFLYKNDDQTLDDDPMNADFNMQELKTVIRQCKKGSAPGRDEISYEVLKKLPDESQCALLKHFNKIWSEGNLPKDWKHCTVIPLLKPNKSAFDPSSYRPIALTSCLCKVMERLIANRLNWFLETNNKLNQYQSGFRKGKSCTDHIMRLQHSVNSFMHTKNGKTLGVFIDLEKAFDLVWRNGLLYKLRKTYGIKGRMYKWIQDFLSDRTLQVKVGEEQSSVYHIENGTPQGSVISPLLFILMINDLPEPKNGVQISMFADDSAIWKSGRNIKKLNNDVQAYLNDVIEFFDEWGFRISETKTVAIVFSKKKPQIKEECILRIHGSVIRIEDNVKFLGMYFDQKLNWTKHIKYLQDKCQKRLNLMRAISGTSWGASKKTLLMIYRTIIRSVLDYGCTAYDSTDNANKEILDKIQRKALAICCGSATGTSVPALQVDCGELPLDLRRKRMLAEQAVKVSTTLNHSAKSAFTAHKKWNSRRCWKNSVFFKSQNILRSISINTEQSVGQPVPSSDLYQLIRKSIADEWQTRWNTNKRGSHYRELEPRTTSNIKYESKPRKKEVLITRLRFQKCRLNAHLHSINCHKDGLCDTCKIPETVEHFLLECKGRTEITGLLISVLNRENKPVTMENILKSTACGDIIYNWIVKKNISL